MKSAINLTVPPYSRDYIRDKATDLMPGTCRFYTQVDVDDDGYDPTSGDYTTPDPTIKWEGPCRLWEVQAGQTIVVGDQEITSSQTFLSLPWDVDPLPEHDDIVEILDYIEDPDLVGRTVVIGDMVRGGGLRASRKFTVQVNSSTKSTW